MKENIIYDVGGTVSIIEYHKGKEEKISGIISMITVNKKGIKYRAKFGFDKQRDFWQDDIVN